MKTGKTLSELAAEIERQHATKKDYVANLDAVTMVAKDNVPTIAVEGIGSFGINDIAHNQIAEHAKIDRRYYDRMRREAPELLATNVDHWFRKFPAPQMLRTLDGNVRAMLSPSFQPLDNYDFAGATLPILSQRKLQVMSCEITERRLYIKAVDEKLFRDVPVGYKMGDGSHQIFDTCAPAIILSNSEVGFGRLVVETGVYTRACTNMCLFSKGGMKRTHVGAKHRLTDGMDVQDLDAIMSSATKRKTMEALWMQVRDVLNAAFDEKVIGKRPRSDRRDRRQQDHRQGREGDGGRCLDIRLQRWRAGVDLPAPDRGRLADAVRSAFRDHARGAGCRVLRPGDRAGVRRRQGHRAAAQRLGADGGGGLKQRNPGGASAPPYRAEDRHGTGTRAEAGRAEAAAQPHVLDPRDVRSNLHAGLGAWRGPRHHPRRVLHDATRRPRARELPGPFDQEGPMMMTRIKFTDDVEFETDGPYRIEEKFDGFYLVGHGMLCPLNDRAEGETMIAELAPPEERHAAELTTGTRSEVDDRRPGAPAEAAEQGKNLTTAQK
jgi:hypothetical protein